MNTREDVEAAIGAIITRFNEVEVALIDLVISMLRDKTKGEAIGWAIGFLQKVKVVRALAVADNLAPVIRERLFAALDEAERLSGIRNGVAHAELWENPTDDSVSFRKGKFGKDGFVPSHPDWDAAQLFNFSSQIEAVADEVRAVRAKYDFEGVTIIREED